jgi:hypothetical protein
MLRKTEFLIKFTNFEGRNKGIFILFCPIAFKSM